ncbi:hypothetical protein SAMD00019534_063830, partial [Acytostelium subglobosum LB1]|uniref:hypothetical protein n=1 Tax=Acytostelium subglobosum LB1 TaxID=1410327 RepID=UPI000645105A
RYLMINKDLNSIRMQQQRQQQHQQHITSNVIYLELMMALCGGKGGFGSLLRGKANRLGQKKTSNFDACRDLSGRRLRHVNNEKRLKEWYESEEARKEALDKFKQAIKKGGKEQVEFDHDKFQEEAEQVATRTQNAVKEGLRQGDESMNVNGHSTTTSTTTTSTSTTTTTSTAASVAASESSTKSKPMGLWVPDFGDEDEEEDDEEDD